MNILLRGREWSVQELVLTALFLYVTAFVAVLMLIAFLIIVMWFGETLYEILPVINPVI